MISKVEETLRHYLSPFLKTLPRSLAYSLSFISISSSANSRAILQSLVRSSDKNSDGAMDFEELTTFGDFNLVYNIWPQHLQMARGAEWGMRKWVIFFIQTSLLDQPLSISGGDIPNQCRCDENSCFPSSISSRRAVFRFCFVFFFCLLLFLLISLRRFFFNIVNLNNSLFFIDKKFTLSYFTSSEVLWRIIRNILYSRQSTTTLVSFSVQPHW